MLKITALAVAMLVPTLALADTVVPHPRYCIPIQTKLEYRQSTIAAVKAAAATAGYTKVSVSVVPSLAESIAVTGQDLNPVNLATINPAGSIDLTASAPTCIAKVLLKGRFSARQGVSRVLFNYEKELTAVTGRAMTTPRWR